MVFSFIGVLDFGFSAYAMIATQNAARIGAMWGAANSINAQSGGTFTTAACNYALDELQYAPTSVSSCGGASPVSVTATYAASGADDLPTVTVAVTYTVTLLAIPGLMPGSLAITRSVQMPVR
jgi:hypothetical protein